MYSLSLSLLFLSCVPQCFGQIIDHWQPPKNCYYNATPEGVLTKYCPEIATQQPCYMISKVLLRAKYPPAGGLSFLNPHFATIEDEMVDPKSGDTVFCNQMPLPPWVKEDCYFIDGRTFACKQIHNHLFNVRVSMSTELVDIGTFDLQENGEFFAQIFNNSERFSAGSLYKTSTKCSGCSDTRQSNDENVQARINGHWGALYNGTGAEAVLVMADGAVRDWFQTALKTAIIAAGQKEMYPVFTHCSGGGFAATQSTSCNGDTFDCPKAFRDGCGYHPRDSDTQAAHPSCPDNCGHCTSHFEAYKVPQWIHVQMYDRDHVLPDQMQVEFLMKKIDNGQCPLFEKLIMIGAYFIPLFEIQMGIGNMLMIDCAVKGSQAPMQGTLPS